MSIAELSRAAASAPYRTGEIGDASAQHIPPETALVPVTAILQPSRWRGRNPSEAPFLTHLIATAEQIPQTRPLWRATAAEAQAAYRSLSQNQQAVTGVRIRQNA